MPADLSAFAQLEPALDQGRARYVAAQVLKRATVRAIDPDFSVEGEARFGVTQGRPKSSLGQVILGGMGGRLTGKGGSGVWAESDWGVRPTACPPRWVRTGTRTSPPGRGARNSSTTGFRPRNSTSPMDDNSGGASRTSRRFAEEKGGSGDQYSGTKWQYGARLRRGRIHSEPV